MAATPFKVISWSPNEPVSAYKLDAMTSNDNWLRDNMVRGNYAAYAVRRTEGIRMASGMALISSSTSPRGSRRVTFGGFFTPGCNPIVTTGIVSAEQRAIFVTIDGVGSTALHPDSTGFGVHAVIYASAKKDLKIKRNFYVSWIAMGY